MVKFLIDKIFVVDGDQVLQQSVGVPMGKNCPPLLANLFLYSYETFKSAFTREEKAPCCGLQFNEMAMIPKSDQSRNTSRNYKSEK
jgi:hypothetical protein